MHPQSPLNFSFSTTPIGCDLIISAFISLRENFKNKLKCYFEASN